MTDIKKKKGTGNKAAKKLKLNKETLKDLTTTDGEHVGGGYAPPGTTRGCPGSKECTDRYHCC